MNLKNLVRTFGNDGELIARFGNAALIRCPDGKWRLQGGSREDRLMAYEWISLFLHEAVVARH